MDSFGRGPSLGNARLGTFAGMDLARQVQHARCQWCIRQIEPILKASDPSGNNKSLTASVFLREQMDGHGTTRTLRITVGLGAPGAGERANPTNSRSEPPFLPVQQANRQPSSASIAPDDPPPFEY